MKYKNPQLHSLDYYFQNIMIAQKYLKQFHLLMDPQSVILDCCYFPSHSDKAFYLQVKKDREQYLGHCAYTYYADYFEMESYSQSFLTVERADSNTAKRGDVICKILQLDTSLIEDLITAVQAYMPTPKDIKIVIDGIYANIRLFEKGEIVSDIRLTHDSKIVDSLTAISKQL